MTRVRVKIRNKLRNIYLLIWNLGKNKFRLRPPVNYYFLKLRRLQSGNQKIKLLKEAIRIHPQNAILHKDLALIYMSEKMWKQANEHWLFLLDTLQAAAESAIYSNYGRSLRREGKLNDGKEVLTQGLYVFPNDPEILFERAEIARREKDWKTSLEYLYKSKNNYQGDLPIRFYLRGVLSHRKSYQFQEADHLLEEAMQVYPKSLKLLKEYAMLAIISRKWSVAKERLEDIIGKFDNSILTDELMRLAIVYQIEGDYSKANYFFEKAFVESEKEDTTNDFMKVNLFDNGESRIEFYKKKHVTSTVVITFDSINIQWSKEPFGFRFLMKENVDIIAVRRRRKDSYQQDLSLGDFYEAVNTLANYYRRKVAYGFSLGAYSALYFGSSLNCNILSLSPRNSAHPIHKGELVRGQEFNHELSHKLNSNIAPTIVFDPKNNIDREYINNELKKSYPDGVFLEFPYAGHRTAPFLLQVGILKDIVQRIIQGQKIPSYKDIDRGKSHQYLRILGNACLRRNKIKWAFDLGERAVKLAPKDWRAHCLKVRALQELGQFTKSIFAAEEANELITDNEALRLLLINLYIENDYIVKAKKLVKESKKEFGHLQEFKNIVEKLHN